MTVLWCGLVLVGALKISGCKSLTPAEKQAAITTEKEACALAHADLPDPEVQALCEISDIAFPAIVNLLGVHRKALAKARAQVRLEEVSVMKCPPSVALSDGGAK